MKELVKGATGNWELPRVYTHARIYRACANYKNGYNLWSGYADGTTGAGVLQSTIEAYPTFAGWVTDLIPYDEEVCSQLIRLNKEEQSKINSPLWIVVKRVRPLLVVGIKHLHWEEFEQWADFNKINNTDVNEWKPFWHCWVAALAAQSCSQEK